MKFCGFLREVTKLSVSLLKKSVADSIYYRNIRFHLPLLTALKHRYSNRFNSR